MSTQMPTPPGGDGTSPATHMPGQVSEQAQLRTGCGAGRPVPRKLHLPEPSQDRQGGIAGSVEQGHLAPAQPQPLTRHCSWREPNRTDSPRLASHLASNPFGLTSQMYHRKMRRPDIVKRCLIIWTVSWNKLSRDNQIQPLKQRAAKHYGPGDCWRCPESGCLWEVACEDGRDRNLFLYCPPDPHYADPMLS